MKYRHQLSLAPPEHPSLSRAIGRAEAARSPRTSHADPRIYGEWGSFALPPVDIDARRQIADALTAIMVQAEATRRISLRLLTDGSDVTTSSAHIIDCAKRIWELIAEEPEASLAR